MEERTFSTREVADLLDLSPDEVRGFARAGLVEPERGERNEYRFEFRDLVVLRMAAGLRRASVPARRIRRALESVRESGRPVAGVRLEALGEHVVVRDGEVVWRPDTGQVQLEFEPEGERAGEEAAAERSEPVFGGPFPGGPARPEAADADQARQAGRTTEREPASERPDAGETADVRRLLQRAVELEGSDPGRALTLYERAAAGDPAPWEAWVGVGYCRQQVGELAGAIEAYRRARALETDATVTFNLAVALDDLGRAEEAVGAYGEALAEDPGLADAHFNLSCLYERQGDRAAALRHLISYRDLVRED